MRHSKVYLVLFAVPLLMFMLPTSCSKTGYTLTTTTADSANQTVTANDELNINYEIDQSVNEALLATTISSIACGGTVSPGTPPEEYTTISDVIIDTSQLVDSALIRLTYYGKNANQTKGRSGVVTLFFMRDSSGKIIPWGVPGAAISINYQQYEVIVLATNVSVWINGTITITNISGGLLKKQANIALSAGDSLQDKINGNIAFTYNDNTSVIKTWTWYINQSRVFNLQNSVLTSTIMGDSTVNGINGISTSGTTRFGLGFNTQITSPVVQTISSEYLLSNPLSGGKSIQGIAEPMIIEYGVDNHGNPVQNGIPYGYKISWTSTAGPATTIVSY